MTPHSAAAHDSLRGLALGDAFGETFFRMSAKAMRQRLGERTIPPGPWRWTDDTAMALSIMQVLRDRGEIDTDALAEQFAARYHENPYRGYGASMHTVLESIGAGQPWREVTRRQFDGAGSWGNGSAMRVAPLGAWFAADYETVSRQATRSAVVTHAHPEATAGAIAVAVAAAASTRGAAPQHLLSIVQEHTPTGDVAKGLRTAAGIDLAQPPRHAAQLLGCGWRISAQDTVPFVLWCAARHLDDLPEALWATASAGGDIDTTCAMVGGIVAARVGLGAIPPSWLDCCEPLPSWV